MSDPFFTPGTFTGPDVNGAKGPVDWQKVKQAGHSFCFLKATEGSSFKDKRFQQNRKDAAAAGLFVGAYHFARPHANSAKDEAHNFLSALGPNAPELSVLDFEDDKGTGDLSGWAWEFLQTVEFLTGRAPLLYTYAPYWKAHGSHDAKFTRYPLWLAAYSAKAPTLAPWPAWKLWQYTDCNTIPGIGGKADTSKFVGAPAEMWNLFVKKAA